MIDSNYDRIAESMLHAPLQQKKSNSTGEVLIFFKKISYDYVNKNSCCKLYNDYNFFCVFLCNKLLE